MSKNMFCEPVYLFSVPVQKKIQSDKFVLQLNYRVFFGHLQCLRVLFYYQTLHYGSCMYTVFVIYLPQNHYHVPFFSFSHLNSFEMKAEQNSLKVKQTDSFKGKNIKEYQKIRILQPDLDTLLFGELKLGILLLTHLSVKFYILVTLI